MSDFLSQDDIDALLGVASFGGGAPAGGAPTNAGEVCDNIVKAYNQHIASVVKLNINRDVDVEIEIIDSVQPTTLTDKIGAEYLLAEIAFSGGTEGSMRAAASKDSFAKISDLLMMGDGSAPYNDDCKDAVSELFSQISGAFATELGGKVGSSVSAAAPAVLDNSGGEGMEGDFAAFCKISIPEIDTITMVISPDETLLEKLAPQFGGKFSEPAAAAAEPVAAPASQPAAAGGMPENSFAARMPKVNVDMLLDIELEVAIELGKTNIAIKKVLDLAPGALVELDRLAGEPVDLLVNNKVVAKGEVVVIDENFGVRIISLVSPEERIRSLR